MNTFTAVMAISHSLFTVVINIFHHFPYEMEQRLSVTIQRILSIIPELDKQHCAHYYSVHEE